MKLCKNNLHPKLVGSRRCLPCQRAAYQEHYTRHRSKILARRKATYVKNQDRTRVKSLKTYYQNKDKTQARRRERNWRNSGITGMTWEQFLRLLTEQNNSCAICAKPIDESAHLDHSHETGNVRGILCQGCNHGVGLLQDSALLCRRAAEYLEEAACVRSRAV